MAGIQRPKGTQDILPDEARFWLHFQDTAREMFGRYGYQYLETPLFERTDLFVRGIGTSTDVVSKEMYEVLSGDNLGKLIAGAHVKANSRFSLRPEGTAGVVRALAENGLVMQGGAPVKVMYAGPMFRAENVQAGRQRQFNQVGVECLGSEDPTIDAEGIIMLMRFYEAVGIPLSSMRLLVNSMGDGNCRPAYRELVRSFIKEHAGELCEECVGRADTNPLRAFDCKKEACRKVMADAPRITEHLCPECRSHYESVLALLRAAGIEYTEDYTLVRGLDYYTRTVFEVQVVQGMGAQNAIGGGGRYDQLMEEIGGQPSPGFGFALGYERCLLALKAHGLKLLPALDYDFYIACVDESVRPKAFEILQYLRDAGMVGDMDHQHRSLKSQFKQANKLKAAFVLVLGPDELAKGVITVRNMVSHTERTVPLSDAVKALRSFLLAVPEAGASTLKGIIDREGSHSNH
ncbi:MAG: histidine--tRNA ligase [Eggerthellaceae bacterium]|jgi:histidyl-tRNA synthetase